MLERLYQLDIITIFTIYVVVVFGGFLLEGYLAKLHFRLTKNHYREHHFSWGKYFFLYTFPIVAVLVIASLAGRAMVFITIAFAIVGPFIEWIVGWTYDQVLGQRLWTYHKAPLTKGKHTSWLSIPYWALAGSMFWLLARLAEVF